MVEEIKKWLLEAFKTLKKNFVEFIKYLKEKLGGGFLEHLWTEFKSTVSFVLMLIEMVFEILYQFFFAVPYACIKWLIINGIKFVKILLEFLFGPRGPFGG
jgi:hypothetical protein